MLCPLDLFLSKLLAPAPSKNYLLIMITYTNLPHIPHLEQQAFSQHQS